MKKIFLVLFLFVFSNNVFSMKTGEENKSKIKELPSRDEQFKIVFEKRKQLIEFAARSYYFKLQLKQEFFFDNKIELNVLEKIISNLTDSIEGVNKKLQEGSRFQEKIQEFERGCNILKELVDALNDLKKIINLDNLNFR